MKHRLFYIFALAALASACADDVLHDGGTSADDGSNAIRIATLSTVADNLTVVESRASNLASGAKSNAEDLEWLREPLFSGFTIIYNKTKDTANERMALLQLNKDPEGNVAYVTEEFQGTTYKVADYSFLKIDPATGNTTSESAKWFGNGEHSFRGIYAPDDLISYSELTPIVTDQHNGNYTLLERYSSMPANCKISATVERIKLPFHHRLARVLAYILIDPEMGSGITLNGYKKDAAGKPQTEEDATTTDFRFENVKVLSSVKKKYNDTKKRFTYTPQWTTARKVIPHFIGELGSYNTTGDLLDADFIMYQNKATKEFITADTEALWKAANSDYETNGETSAYVQINYGKVPVYDLIVRPTYSYAQNIMYDEADLLENTTNSIDFTLKLSNGLEYEKKFEFDLNANEMTVVYLRISREQVDYNSSGSETWIPLSFYDGYHGVNNENGNTLSLAGGSWQRAYRIGDTDPGITDGSGYKEDGEEDHITGEDGQYLSKDKWIERFKQATKDGKHHGDYFILDSDITITSLPADFVFTGHLDGRGHTITITGATTEPTPDPTPDPDPDPDPNPTPAARDYRLPHLAEEAGIGGGTARSYLFDGLNARYTTAQENNASETSWEANVHRENGTWVPLMGFRAEVLNTKVAGGTMFKPDATFGDTDTDDVNGYIFNCSDTSGKVTNTSVDIPDYK